MSRAPTKRLAPAPALPRPACHGPDGCAGDREAGAASRIPPDGAAPTLVSAAEYSSPVQGHWSPGHVPAAAALTIFEGQAVFRVEPGNGSVPKGTLFRLRRGSREYHSLTVPL